MTENFPPIVLGAAVLIVAALFFMGRPGLLPGTGPDIPEDSGSRLDQIAANLVSGGPPKDGIPPIEEPKYLDADEADLADNEVVFGIKRGDFVAAYPQRILVWHEIVNEKRNGEKFSVTYCPLTGSAIGFEGDTGGYNTTYGTSGKLGNSCLVMYDRATDSYWPQIFGRAVTGPRKGETLPQFSVVWTRWGKWKEAHPDTKVLSEDTGFARAYGNDPYGSYQADDTYYQEGGPLFPVEHRSDRFPPKTVVIGVKADGNFLAVPKDVAREEHLIVTDLGGKDIVVIYDETLGDALAYETGGRDFTLRDDGTIVDEDGTEYDIWGEGSDGSQLEYVKSFNAMWYGWYAFYPDTDVYEA